MDSLFRQEHWTKNQVLEWFESLKDIDKAYRYEVSFSTERPWHNAVSCEYDKTTDEYMVGLRVWTETKSPLVARDNIIDLMCAPMREFDVVYDFYDPPTKSDKLTRLLMGIKNPVTSFTLHKNTLNNQQAIGVAYRDGIFIVESQSYGNCRDVESALISMKNCLCKFLTEDNAIDVYKPATLEDLAGEPI